MRNSMRWWLLGGLLALLWLGGWLQVSGADWEHAQSDPVQTQPPMAGEFVPIAPQGFDDPSNSGAWAMQWWKGKLYVGTVREFECWTIYGMHMLYPNLVPWPPTDVEMGCTPDLADLPLRAEIWRYSPGTEVWERVFQSPEDVVVPGDPVRYTARDVGFRGMGVFTETNGVGALYVGGAYPAYINPENPPLPRLLRSEDGESFEAVPQDPGTFLGDLDSPGFRGIETYNDRMYIIASSTIWGAGEVLEAVDPAGGNDNFETVTPEGLGVFEMAPYNGNLYLGTSTRDVPPPPGGSGSQQIQLGYEVLKTDATGTRPYTLTTVVEEGGYRTDPPEGVVSMHVFGGRLYVGTDFPPEIIRINPDDSWDLIVGLPRETPDGPKWPLSGLDSGFGWFFNIHIWRMDDQEGVLYAGTMDTSSYFRDDPYLGLLYRDQMGFDLYASSDGVYFAPITVNGFSNLLNAGLRSFASTPFGLYIGGVNFWEGLQVWGQTGAQYRYSYLPYIAVATGEGLSTSTSLPASLPKLQADAIDAGFLQQAARGAPRAPGRLEAESIGAGGAWPGTPAVQGNGTPPVLLSWSRPDGAARFRVFRSEAKLYRGLIESDSDAEIWVPGRYVDIAATDSVYYIDTNVRDGSRYYYYVVAEDGGRRMSLPSNAARSPSLEPAMTFTLLGQMIADWAGKGRFAASGIKTALDLAVRSAQDQARSANLADSLRTIEQLRHDLLRSDPEIIAPWCSQDLEIMLSKLARRIRLAQLDLISPAALD